MNAKALLSLLLFHLVFLSSFAFSQNQGVESDESIEAQYQKGNTISMFNMFREQSYIILGSGLGNLNPLVFEGDIIPYFMISLSQNARWGMEISPRIIIRMFNKHSYPVQTPSYMPKATIFYQFPDISHRKRDFFTFLSWMHYSNGQDGNFYNADSTTINTATGSFSTYWVHGGVFLSRPSDVLKFNTNYIKLYAEYNYMQQSELDGIYGHLRFFVNIKNTVKLSDAFRTIVAAEKSDKKYVFEQSIKIGWIADEMTNAKIIDERRLILNYTLSFKPVFLKDVNFFIHYYFGQDYYNIHFERHLSVVRFGIASKSSILF
ncbi:MAG: hypothetical protein PHT92_09165 [Bacteroidales bacterium]|jgi:hypothetical protein|nr:hypothetical protein [Bacteroidales bacterium]